MNSGTHGRLHVRARKRKEKRGLIIKLLDSPETGFNARMAELKPARGYGHLHQQLIGQATTLRRKGIPEEVIKSEINNLASAIWSELWRLLSDVPAHKNGKSS